MLSYAAMVNKLFGFPGSFWLYSYICCEWCLTYWMVCMQRRDCWADKTTVTPEINQLYVWWSWHWLNVIQNKWLRRCVGVCWTPNDAYSECVCLTSSCRCQPVITVQTPRQMDPVTHRQHWSLLLVILPTSRFVVFSIQLSLSLLSVYTY